MITINSRDGSHYAILTHDRDGISVAIYQRGILTPLCGHISRFPLHATLDRVYAIVWPLERPLRHVYSSELGRVVDRLR